MDKTSSPARRVAIAPMATVFVSSACIMVIELVAGRVVSCYLGQSLYTWTSIIGVVLAGISLGNYLGGRLADRTFSRVALCVQFIVAALLCLSVLLVNGWIGPVLAAMRLSWPARILLHVSTVFLLPAAALGTISPVIARRALERGAAAGRTVGGVYAWATAGSILGALGTGYFLLMWMGVTAVVASASGVLALVGAIYATGAIMTRTQQKPQPGPSVSGERLPIRAWLIPITAVFAANASVMAIEVAAGRIMSRHYGQSLYTWTSVIAVVLAGMALGSYLGGRWADRGNPRKTLGWLFALAALSTEYILMLSQFFSDQTFLIGLSWPAQIAAHALGAFFLPAVALGAVSPVAVKAALSDPRTAGRAIGNLYAWGSAAGILGTFLTGFFLIAALGVVHVLHVVAVVLVVVAITLERRSKVLYVAAALCCAAVFVGVAPLASLDAPSRRAGLRDVPPARAVYLDESAYSYIAVTEKEGQPDVRELLLDRLIHSRVNLKNPQDLRYDYEWIYTGVLDKLCPEGRPMEALVIGGGGYTYPHYLEMTRPGSRIDVAEIDPAVTRAATAAFGLPSDTSVSTFNLDARNFVEDLLHPEVSGAAACTYDCILGDSVNDYSVPYHLTTFEFNEKVKALLNDKGVYLLNLIDVFDSGRFLGAVINTCRRSFPYVYVFNSLNDPARRDTFVVVNAKRPLDVSALAKTCHDRFGYRGELLDDARLDPLLRRTGGLVLTDDFAPVEILLAPVARTSRETYPTQLLDTANSLLAQNRLDDAIAMANLVLRSRTCVADAYEVIGSAQRRAGKLEEAVDALQRAVMADPARVSALNSLAQTLHERGDLSGAIDAWNRAITVKPDFIDGYEGLATVFTEMDEPEGALAQRRKAAYVNPKSADARTNLGMALFRVNKFSEAIREFNAVLEIDPHHLATRQLLAISYWNRREFDEAWEQVRLLKAEGRPIEPRFLEALTRDSGRNE